ncbi:retrovirus-related pol polyprotein from transposon TNT 1-94 [Tanacetum coccineum]|uniref:Retrovirus-related pol polyprotein from transposon TNT 1-94 n=1 Tax=Tanacetum coccineum TaxID=301880 RepID=A0ABQ5HSZ7_9ASTR
MWIITRGDESLILWRRIDYLKICLEHKFSSSFFQHFGKLKSQEREIPLQFQVWYIWFTSSLVTSNSQQNGTQVNARPRRKWCEKNYSSVRRYVADPVNAYPKQSTTKLILKGAVIFDVCMGYLVRAYYNISSTKYYKDDSCWSADLKSNTTEDVISIGSFMEVLVLNHYVLVRKLLERTRTPKAVKRIFPYLKGTVNWGLWCPKDSSIALIAYVNADHAGCQDTRRSTYGSMQFLGDRLVAGHQKGRKALQYPVRKLNTSLYSAVVLKSYGRDQNSLTTTLYSTRFQCTVLTKAQLPYAATTSNIPEYLLVDIFIKALCRERIEFLSDKLGMKMMSPDTLKKLADEVDE